MVSENIFKFDNAQNNDAVKPYANNFTVFQIWIRIQSGCWIRIRRSSDLEEIKKNSATGEERPGQQNTK
jgi:hypothetical protein